MESLLPPIRVTKFRWCSDELDLLNKSSTDLPNRGKNKKKLIKPRNEAGIGANTKLDDDDDDHERSSDMLECPVCGAFASSTVNALNAHVDGCLAQACREESRQMRRRNMAAINKAAAAEAAVPTKAKPPKERSIVEIFAAAPQIHKAGTNSSSITKQTMESLLPPFKVTKFRRWSDELELLNKPSTELPNKGKNNKKLIKPRNDVGEKNKLDDDQGRSSDMLECPVCGAFAASTVNALNAHVDGCLAQTCREERRRQMKRMTINKAVAPPTKKSRPPKKRSIVEIFAAAPEIHKADTEDDDDHCSKSNCKIQRPKKKNKKKNKNKEVGIVKKLMKKKNSKLKKKNNNKNYKKHDELINVNKENGGKLKLQTPVNFSRKSNDTSCNKGSKAVSTVRKEPNLECLSAMKKSKIVQTSELIVGHEKPTSNVRGIVKNPAKSISDQNASMHNLKATTQASTCGLQHSVRHVGFSEKSHQNEGDEEILAGEINRSDEEDVSFNTENGITVQATLEKLQLHNLKATSQASTCGVQHSVRHVSFSGKDDILGPHKKHPASVEKCICRIDLDPFDLSEKGHQNEGDEEFLAGEVNRSDEEDVSFSTENGITVQATLEKLQLLGHVALDAGSLHVPSQGYQSAFHNSPYSGVPRLISSQKEIQNPFDNSQARADVSVASNYNPMSVDYFGDHSEEVALSSKTNPMASLQPSSSGFALSKNATESAPFTSQFALDSVSGHALSHQPLYSLSPVELMGRRLCPFSEWKQKTVAFQEKYRDEEFFGLPLNSQGELVQAKSSGKGGSNQLKQWNSVSGSSNSVNNLVLPWSRDDDSIIKGKYFIESALPNNLLSLFPGQNHVKENTTVHSLSRLGTTELQGQRKDDGYYLNSDRRCNPMDSGLNSINTSSCGRGQYDQFQNQKNQCITHANKNADNMLLNSPRPTMRLMGKDVTICRSSSVRQEFADGKVWTDKEVIEEHYPQNTAFRNSYVDRHFPQDRRLDPASGKLKETPAERFEMERNLAFPGNVYMRPLESNFFQPCLNWQANSEFTSHGIFVKGADIQEPFISRIEDSRVGSQLPAASTSQRNYQNINGNSVGIGNEQSLLNAGKPSFNFPFLHSDHVEHVQPTWFQGSSKSLIPWLLQATHQVKAPSTPSQPIPQVCSRHQHQPHTARSSLLTNHMVPHPPIVSYDHNPMISHPQMENSVWQPSIAHSPHFPQAPGNEPTFSVNMSYRNRSKVKDRMKSKSVNIQDPDIFQKSRKRSGAIEDHTMKPSKIPNLGVLDERRPAIWLTREKLIENIQCNKGSLEVEPERNETSMVGWIRSESQFNEFGLSAVIDSSKVDGVTRPDPFKICSALF